MLEILGDGRALDDFRKAGRIDIMLDNNSVLLSVFVHIVEPFPNAVVQLDIGPETMEAAAREPDMILLGFVVHQFHIGQNVGSILADGDTVALGPKLFRRLANSLDEPELLHVARRKGAVEVVN